MIPSKTEVREAVASRKKSMDRECARKAKEVIRHISDRLLEGRPKHPTNITSKVTAQKVASAFEKKGYTVEVSWNTGTTRRKSVVYEKATFTFDLSEFE